MGAAALSVVLYSGSLSLFDIVESQNHPVAGIFAWNLFRKPGRLRHLRRLRARRVATARRSICPRQRQELVGGYHTEYSGRKFGMFFLAEYVNLWMASLLLVTTFLGGYLLPWDMFFAGFLPGWFRDGAPRTDDAHQDGVHRVLLYLIRWTLPRFKYNQLMNLGWKNLLPISIANIL